MRHLSTPLLYPNVEKTAKKGENKNEKSSNLCTLQF